MYGPPFHSERELSVINALLFQHTRPWYHTDMLGMERWQLLRIVYELGLDTCAEFSWRTATNRTLVAALLEWCRLNAHLRVSSLERVVERASTWKRPKGLAPVQPVQVATLHHRQLSSSRRVASVTKAPTVEGQVFVREKIFPLDAP